MFLFGYIHYCRNGYSQLCPVQCEAPCSFLAISALTCFLFFILFFLIICSHIVRELCSTFKSRVDAATCLFDDAEITLVGISDFDAAEILVIGSIKEGQILVENSVVLFFFKDATVFSEQFFAILAILTILPSENFSSTQTVSKLNSQPISFLIIKIVSFFSVFLVWGSDV